MRCTVPATFDRVWETPTKLMVDQLTTFVFRSLNKVGGITVVLLLYPKVVELSAHMQSFEAECYQVLALKSLLNLRRSSAIRGKEFAASEVPDLLHKVICCLLKVVESTFYR